MVCGNIKTTYAVKEDNHGKNKVLLSTKTLLHFHITARLSLCFIIFHMLYTTMELGVVICSTCILFSHYNFVYPYIICFAVSHTSRLGLFPWWFPLWCRHLNKTKSNQHDKLNFGSFHWYILHIFTQSLYRSKISVIMK